MAKEKKYKIYMTEKQMQFIANAVSGFYTMATEQKMRVSPEQTAVIGVTLENWKKAIARGYDTHADLVLLDPIS